MATSNYESLISLIIATPNEDDGCGDPGCFSDEMQYSATKEQIEALMKISTECTQSSFQRFITANQNI